jgi:hypothetical protein
MQPHPEIFENTITINGTKKKFSEFFNLANIIDNRNSVNDRTDKSIYGDDAMRPVTYNGRTGYMYKGEDKAEPEITGETEFEKEVKTEIYNEILSEGGFSAINAYDGEIITWGKGFAVNGQLMEVFELIYENDNIDFKQMYNNVGIKIVDDYLWVLDSPTAASLQLVA